MMNIFECPHGSSLAMLVTCCPACLIARLEQELERADNERQVAENKLEEQQENELELIEACIWNLEQCPSAEDYCNDITRVYDRLLRRQEELTQNEK